MHTIWMREHNRVADELKNLGNGWDDERLFQEARRIVIAEYQHIIYNEWLPLIVGKNVMIRSGMAPKAQGFSKFYSGKLTTNFLFKLIGYTSNFFLIPFRKL